MKNQFLPITLYGLSGSILARFIGKTSVFTVVFLNIGINQNGGLYGIWHLPSEAYSIFQVPFGSPGLMIIYPLDTKESNMDA